MDLRDLIQKHKTEMAEAWFQEILATYPAETAKFIGSGKDNMANPVGAAFSQGLHNLLDALFQNPNPDKINEALDKILRIRAVQNFSPSQAVGFIFSLRKILKRTAQSERAAGLSEADEALLENEMDKLLSAAFDVYMACREELFTLRVNREKNLAQKALKKMGYLKGTSKN
jgi:hypothetical protein